MRKKQADLFQRQHSYIMSMTVEYFGGRQVIIHAPFTAAQIAGLVDATRIMLCDNDFHYSTLLWVKS
jgi:hypothetical protein